MFDDQVCVGRPQELLPERLTDCVVTGWGRRSESEFWSFKIMQDSGNSDQQFYMVLGCQDFADNCYRVFCEHYLPKCPPPLRQRDTICGFLRDLSSTATVTWPSLQSSSSLKCSSRWLLPWLWLIIIKMFPDSEHSVVLKEISVPLWNHDRCTHCLCLCILLAKLPVDGL